MEKENRNDWHTCEEWEKCMPYAVQLVEVKFDAKHGKFIYRAVALVKESHVVLQYNHRGEATSFYDEEAEKPFTHEDSLEEGFNVNNIAMMTRVRESEYDIKWE